MGTAKSTMQSVIRPVPRRIARSLRTARHGVQCGCGACNSLHTLAAVSQGTAVKKVGSHHGVGCGCNGCSSLHTLAATPRGTAVKKVGSHHGVGCGCNGCSSLHTLAASQGPAVKTAGS